MSRSRGRHLHLRGWAALGAAGALAVSALSVAGASGAGAAEPAQQATTFSVTSFDGTTVTGDYFTTTAASAGHRAPTVLFGPGWGGASFTDPTMPTSTSGGTIGIAPLLAAGYNVVSWNPRGFHSSTGQAEADDARFEGRDVSAILTWVARQPWAQLDSVGDPRVGMVGGSYGGGVQWAAAAFDHRIDAIVPDISWHSLATSLDPNDTAKTGWDTLLYGGAQAAGQRDDPRIDKAFVDARASFRVPADDVRFLAARGPDGLVSGSARPP